MTRSLWYPELVNEARVERFLADGDVRGPVRGCHDCGHAIKSHGRHGGCDWCRCPIGEPEPRIRNGCERCGGKGTIPGDSHEPTPLPYRVPCPSCVAEDKLQADLDWYAENEIEHKDEIMHDDWIRKHGHE